MVWGCKGTIYIYIYNIKNAFFSFLTFSDPILQYAIAIFDYFWKKRTGRGETPACYAFAFDGFVSIAFSATP